MPNVEIHPIDRDVYSRLYQLESPDFNGNTVYIHADCYKTPSQERLDGYYILELFISVAGYGTKDHLIGLSFGDGPMTKVEIDQKIDSYVDSQVDDLFFAFVQDYMDKEKMWENELESRES